MRPHRTADGVGPEHPAETTLLTYLDGELPAADAASAAAHLETCAACRERVTDLRTGIDAFLRIRRSAQPEELGPARMGALRQRLATQQARPQRRLAFIVRAALGRLATLAVPSTVSTIAVRNVACLATFALLVAWLYVPVSASRVLDQAAVQEHALDAQRTHVAHTLVTIERVEGDDVVAQIGALDTASDAATARRRIGIRRTDGAQTQQVLARAATVANRSLFAGAVDGSVLAYLDRQGWVPSLSVHEYQKLIAGRGASDGTGRRAWGGLFEVRHPFAAGHPSRVTEARIWLDRDTYRPTRISLFADEQGRRVEYRFTQVLFELVPRSPAWARVFATPVPALGAATPSPRPDAPPARPETARPAPAWSTWNATPATDREVAAAAALHALDADLGEDINIFPTTDGQVFVQGIVAGDARRRAIEAGLRPLAGVRVELFAPDETRDQATPVMLPTPWVLLPAPWMTASEAIAIVRRHSNRAGEEPSAGDAQDEPADAPGPQTEEARIGRLLALSDRTFVHAWALQRLDAEFAERRSAGLSQASREQIDEMRHAHLKAIARGAGRIRHQARALFGEALVPVHPSSTPPAIVLTSDFIGGLAAEQHALARVVCDPSVGPARQPRALDRLLMVLGHLARAVDES